MCVLLQAMCDMKAAQMDVQSSSIEELILYKCKLGHNITEATKYLSCAKGEDTADHKMVHEILFGL